MRCTPSRFFCTFTGSSDEVTIGPLRASLIETRFESGELLSVDSTLACPLPNLEEAFRISGGAYWGTTAEVNVTVKYGDASSSDSTHTIQFAGIAGGNRLLLSLPPASPPPSAPPSPLPPSAPPPPPAGPKGACSVYAIDSIGGSPGGYFAIARPCAECLMGGGTFPAPDGNFDGTSNNIKAYTQTVKHMRGGSVICQGEIKVWANNE